MPYLKVAKRATIILACLGVLFGCVMSLIAPLWIHHVQGKQIAVITSGSMIPEIKSGDSVFITRTGPDFPYRPGQIVTFQSSADRLTTHRIVSLERPENTNGLWLRTKGDANPTPDPDFVPTSNVVGIVDEPGGLFAHWLWRVKEPFWRMLFFAPALVLLALAEIPVIFARYEGKHAKPSEAHVPETVPVEPLSPDQVPTLDEATLRGTTLETTEFLTQQETSRAQVAATPAVVLPMPLPTPRLAENGPLPHQVEAPLPVGLIMPIEPPAPRPHADRVETRPSSTGPAHVDPFERPRLIAPPLDGSFENSDELDFVANLLSDPH